MYKLLLLLLTIFLLSGCEDVKSVYTGITPIADHRGEEQTYLTLPEWYIVYISDEYAQFIKNKPPSGFSYFSSIGQFWRNYNEVYALTKGRYPFNAGYHAMIVFIGVSTTLEYGFKGIYENTIGRLTELTRMHGLTAEDLFAYETAADYVKFIRVYPWYEYRFDKRLRQLWTDTSFLGEDQIRKTERKIILTAEYGFKAVYGLMTKKLTKISYEEPSPVTVVLVDMAPETVLYENPDIQLIKKIADHAVLISLPRYDAFKDAAMVLAQQDVKFKEISGNTREILVTGIANQDWRYKLDSGEMLFEENIPGAPGLKRIAVRTSVASLNRLLLDLVKQHVCLEHVYDY